MASRTPSRIVLIFMLILNSWKRLIPRKKTISPKTIWLVHQLLLGDTIMLTGLLAKLKKNHPNAQLIMIAKQGLLPLYETRPYDIKYYEYNPCSIKSLLSLLLISKADWAIIPGDNRYGWLALALGAKWIVAFEGDRPAYKHWCIDELIKLPALPMALPDMLMRLTDGAHPPPYSINDWKFSKTGNIERPANKYVIFHVGAKSETKHWATNNWVSLIHYFHEKNLQVILSAGPSEEQPLYKIKKQVDIPAYPGNLQLLELVELMKGALLNICLDNGIGQLAKVIGTPTLCLFGPGSSQLFGQADFWENMPYKAATIPISCRNTHSLFKREIMWIQTCNRSEVNCIQSTFICMDSLSVNYVIETINKNFLVG